MKKIKLTEMKNADVRFISLVKRGANRIPFRIIKSDQESTVNLSDLRRAVKQEVTKPTIIGIVVQPADEPQLLAISTAIKAAGYSVETAKKYDDGSVMFSQGNDAGGEGTILRLSESVALVIKGMDDEAEVLREATDLNDALAAEGYFHGAPVAIAALGATVMSVLKSDETPAVQLSALKLATEKFESYVATLISTVPTAALKMESDVALASSAYLTKKAEDEAAVVTDAAKAAEDAAKVLSDAAAVAEAALAAAPVAVIDPVVTQVVVDPVVVADEKATKTEEVLLGLGLQLAEMSKVLKSVVDTVASVKESQGKLEEKVEETARKADTANQAVKSTVLGSAGAGDEPAEITSVQKADTDLRTGFFDTAFLRKQK